MTFVLPDWRAGGLTHLQILGENSHSYFVKWADKYNCAPSWTLKSGANEALVAEWREAQAAALDPAEPDSPVSPVSVPVDADDADEDAPSPSGVPAPDDPEEVQPFVAPPPREPIPIPILAASVPGMPPPVLETKSALTITQVHVASCASSTACSNTCSTC